MTPTSFNLISYTRAEAQAPARGAQPKWGKQRTSPPAVRVVLQEGERDDAWGAEGVEGQQTAALRVLQERKGGSEVCLDAIYLHRFRDDGGRVIGLAARVQGSQLQVRWAVSKSPDLFRRFQIAFCSASDCAAFVECVGSSLPTTVLPPPPVVADGSGGPSGGASKATGKRRQTTADRDSAKEGRKKRRSEGADVSTSTVDDRTGQQREPAGPAPALDEEPNGLLVLPISSTATGVVPLGSGPAHALTSAATHPIHQSSSPTSPRLAPDPTHPQPTSLIACPPPGLAAPQLSSDSQPPIRVPDVSPVMADLIDLTFSPARPDGPAAIADTPSSPASARLPEPLEPSRPAPLVDLSLPSTRPSAAAAAGDIDPAFRFGSGGVYALDDPALRAMIGDVLAEPGFEELLARVERVLGAP